MSGIFIIHELGIPIYQTGISWNDGAGFEHCSTKPLTVTLPDGCGSGTCTGTAWALPELS